MITLQIVLMIMQDSQDEDSIRFLQKILIGQEMRYFIDLKETQISFSERK